MWKCTHAHTLELPSGTNTLGLSVDRRVPCPLARRHGYRAAPLRELQPASMASSLHKRAAAPVLLLPRLPGHLKSGYRITRGPRGRLRDLGPPPS